MEAEPVTEVTSSDVFVIIPAWNEQERIAATVRAAAALGPVLVMDDGSRDATTRIARRAGARVLTTRNNLGKGAAMAAGVAALPQQARYVLFLDADLEDTASQAGPLVDAVRSGSCDMAIALPPPQPGGGHGLVVGLAREGIKRLTGFDAAAPLSGQRCLTREAAEAVRYAARFGVEVGLTIDLLRAGYEVAEVPADLRHRVTGEDWRSQIHRARQYRDVLLALRSRSLPPRSP
ncbi:glycosyl transferase family 2 [Catenulispora acidiphila DSM 44928]|uniref:Glucosyl-3-phosphoglycerate synthase n=1 Tax=Catenulispora acidiphila (strain DSM 44928 / JCM 14897 / NBRC 102108 / NRRL B-24433 / ID139908) TaxID=479433 RepID=C7QJ54_CATAD|nr:glycosyltransferase [Catenulispora acidiphila]ACU69196.1 glycosyl transferase family 2 [Catenulispora acidiphila DSM 44928]